MNLRRIALDVLAFSGIALIGWLLGEMWRRLPLSLWWLGLLASIVVAAVALAFAALLRTSSNQHPRD